MNLLKLSACEHVHVKTDDLVIKACTDCRVCSALVRPVTDASEVSDAT